MHRKKAVRAVLFCMTCAVLVAFVLRTREDNRFNFGVVKPGVLMRSAQPHRNDLAEILKEYGLKTIVSLRGEERMASDGTCIEEVAFAEEHGVNLVNLPTSTPPKEEQIAEFLKIVDDPVNHPVLVHCAAGQIRASMMCAAYGMERLGWSNETALAEQEPFKFERSGRNKDKAREFILEYRPKAPARQAPEQP